MTSLEKAGFSPYLIHTGHPTAVTLCEDCFGDPCRG